jgi:hypothetical protein
LSKHYFSLSFAVIQLLAAPTIFAGGIYLTELGTPVSLATAGVWNVVNNVSPDSAFTNPAGMTGVKQDSTLGGVQALSRLSVLILIFLSLVVVTAANMT